MHNYHFHISESLVFKWCRPNVEVTGPKLTAGFDSRGGLRSEATTGARRTKLAVNLWSGAEIRWAISG
jgi:hypothetical protein